MQNPVGYEAASDNQASANACFGGNINEAVTEAGATGLFLHAQANIVVHQPMLKLIEEVRKIVPPSIDGFFFSNSGAEAVEGAIKLARAATGKQAVIVFTGSFHGRTSLTMALTTSKTGYKGVSQLLPSGVYVAPYPYAFRLGMGQEEAGQYALRALKELLVSQISPADTAAILVEPVLGEGGYVVPPASFLKGLREICDENKILLIFDEVQSGMGRTGRWFAADHCGVTPDIMAVAKGIASGFPLSAVVAGKKLMQRWDQGAHGTTFGGNPLSCAASLATIEVIQDQQLLAKSTATGAMALRRMRELAAGNRVIGDVRGFGHMIGVEFIDNKGGPNDNACRKVIDYCLEKGLILIGCGLQRNIIRFIPPIITGEAEIDMALDIFERGLGKVV